MVLTKDRLDRLIDRSTDIVVGTDRNGTVIYYNDGAMKSLRYTEEEVLGSFVGRLYDTVDEAKRVMSAMRSPSNGGKGIVETFQTTFLSKKGEKIPVAISGTLLYDTHGEEDGTIGFAKDLREILHKDQLATLGEVAIGLSHEINNPLEVILNQLDLLEGDVARLAGEGDISVECERLDAMRREVARITGILERLGRMVADEVYETIDYIGPARMIDLRRHDRGDDDKQLAGLRLLVVDDDLGILSSLTEMLERSGASVETASDGVAALAQLKAGSFDLVLTDVVMPRMDGYELYTAIREQHPELPVLMMTAFHYDKDHIIKRSRLSGLEGVLFKKPVDPARLRQVVLETVGKARSKK